MRAAKRRIKDLVIWKMSKFLQLHTSLLGRLPVLLRIYVECAAVLCGDIAGV